MRAIFMKKIILLLIIVFVGCSSTNKNTESKKIYDYSDVTTHIEWKDTFNQQETLYFVYFYSVSCSYCNELKEDFLNYYFSANEKIYFVETSSSPDARFGNVASLKGVGCLDELVIYGTPALISINDRIIDEYYFGLTQIREYINLET